MEEENQQVQDQKPKTSEFEQLRPVYAQKLNSLIEEMAEKGISFVPTMFVEQTPFGNQLLQKVVHVNYNLVPIPKKEPSKAEQKKKKKERKK